MDPEVKENMKDDLIIDKLIDLAAESSIAHHIPGRIRLKVKLPALLQARDLEISDLVNRFSGILDARANLGALSIVISYDAGIVTPALWERLVNGKNDPEQRESMREQLQKLALPANE